MPFVYYLPDTSLQALAEIKRLLQCDFTLKQVDESAFQQHLAHVYQSKSSILEAGRGHGRRYGSLIAGKSIASK